MRTIRLRARRRKYFCFHNNHEKNVDHVFDAAWNSKKIGKMINAVNMFHFHRYEIGVQNATIKT